jgi:hypothetical protein
MGRASKGGGSSGRSAKGKPFGRDWRFKKLEPEPFGEGGKAQVWKAKDQAARPFDPERIVAIKLLKRGADPEDRLRLCREGGRDRRFKHENVVRIFDLRGGPRSPFLVMEYIDGEDLSSLLTRYGRMDPERVAQVGAQLCAGLQFLHVGGLIHRDVKPGNAMLTGDLNGEEPIGLKLIDLGIAQAPEDPGQTREGGFVGSEPYVAPEVKAGEPATEVSDIYGAGAVLYELATDMRLLPLSWQEVWDQRRAKPVRPPHQVNPDVPGWLSAVIMRAIEVEPGKRYQAAEEMERALEEGATPCLSEDPTNVIDDAHEAATEVMGVALTEVMPGAAKSGPSSAKRPFVFRLMDALPLWVRRRLPEGYEDEPPPDWYLFLMMLGGGAFLVAVVFLPIAIRVVATLLEIPPWLLTTGVLVAMGAALFLRDETRRQVATRALRATGGGLRSALIAGGGGLWRALRAGSRSFANAAASAWRWVSARSRELPTSPVEESDDRHGDGGPARKAADLGRRAFAAFTAHRERRRGLSTNRRRTAEPRLRGFRLQLAEVGFAIRAWVPWLGRRAYLIVLVALAVCLALWLSPPLQNQVARRPPDHRTVLVVVPSAAWILVATFGLFRLRASRGSPRSLLAAGAALLAVLAALGMAMPSFSSSLETRLWPHDQVQRANGHGSDRPTTLSPTTAVALAFPRRTPRQAARAASRRLVAKVRRVRSAWTQLFRKLRHQDWTLDADTTAAVRESAFALTSRLNDWKRLSQYESARKAARHWSKSMERARSNLIARDCSRFYVGARGASARC